VSREAAAAVVADGTRLQWTVSALSLRSPLLLQETLYTLKRRKNIERSTQNERNRDVSKLLVGWFIKFWGRTVLPAKERFLGLMNTSENHSLKGRA
jgi:hypothetical protein